MKKSLLLLQTSATHKFFLSFVFFLCLFLISKANIKMSAPFTNHMVLQRNQPLPIWGTAAAAEKVTVTLNGQTQSVTTPANGKWKVVFTPMKEAGPLNLVIKGKNTVTITDVYLGEVWNCAGQSNMALTLNDVAFGTRFTDTITNANLPLLRYMNTRLAGSGSTYNWQVVSPTTAGGCSATGFFFGKELVKKLGCAVGLIKTAVGGTVLESWFDTATVAAHPNIITTNNVIAGSNFNSYVAFVVPYAIKGTVWIQGEQNTYDTVLAPLYAERFQWLIKGWRAAWQQGDFPFCYGQITADRSGGAPDTASLLAIVRNAQTQTLALPSTAMTVNMDINSGGGWHFPNKYEAGRRLALCARAIAYGETDLEYSGPILESSSFDADTIRLKFSHVGNGMFVKGGGNIKTLAICGTDNKWYSGISTINGNTVSVYSPSVKAPVSASYAWGNRPSGINFFNATPFGDTLPASLFKTTVDRTVLPLQQIAVLAKMLSATAVALQWQPNLSPTPEYYVVLRSLNGKDFSTIQTQRHHAAATQFFTDNMPANSQRVYYQIKAVDASGKATYSNVISLLPSLTQGDDVVLYPNPASSAIKINYQCSHAGLYGVRIINTLGLGIISETHNLQYGSNTINVSLQGLPAGNYVLCIVDLTTNKVTCQAFVKQ